MTDGGVDADGSTAPRSMSVRRMLVQAMPYRVAGVSRARSVGRWTIDAVELEVTASDPARMTSTGSSSGRGTPQRRAAERCEASAGCADGERPPAMIRCSGVSGVPMSRATQRVELMEVAGVDRPVPGGCE